MPASRSSRASRAQPAHWVAHQKVSQRRPAARRAALIGALADRGIAAHGRSGLNVWVNVREEAAVVRALLNAGWLVLPGERFRIATPPGIRITAATLMDGEAEEIAEIIAKVEHAGRPRRAY